MKPSQIYPVLELLTKVPFVYIQVKRPFKPSEFTAKRSLKIFILIILTVFKSFGQTKIAERYKTKKFDVVIFLANPLDMILGKRFTPTKTEIKYY